MNIAEKIKRHEGLSLKPYRCPAGKLSIGYGRNLDDVGISREEAEFLFETDLIAAMTDIRAIFGQPLTSNRFNAFVDMRYQLGPKGFRSFKRLIQAAQAEDWQGAYKECLYSNYARQVPIRAQENAEALRYG